MENFVVGVRLKDGKALYAVRSDPSHHDLIFRVEGEERELRMNLTYKFAAGAYEFDEKGILAFQSALPFWERGWGEGGSTSVVPLDQDVKRLIDN